MTIRMGVLLPGFRPIGQGINDAVRGFADLGTGRDDPVVAKFLQVEEILAEAFCSYLCRLSGMKSPEPLILRCQSTNRDVFATIDLEHPNFAHYLDLTDPRWEAECCRRILAWPGATATIAFDEWVNNRDRNIQNLVWLGVDDYALIDHGKSLGVDSSYRDQNIIAQFVVNGTVSDVKTRERIANEAVVFAKKVFSTAIADDTRAEIAPILTDRTILDRFVGFVSHRLSCIESLIRNRFPHTQLQLGLDSP